MPEPFTSAARHLIAKRAGSLCANPLCRRPCPEAGDDAGTAVAIEGLPRPGRPGADTGIWLCATCAAAVEQDRAAYPPERLKEWKEDHGEHVLVGGIVPVPPLLAIRTLEDLHVTQQARFTPPESMRAAVRDHEILISNQGMTPLSELRLRFQFPEGVVCPVAQRFPPGREVTVAPEGPGTDPSIAFHVTISHLEPGEAAALIVRCVQGAISARLMPGDNEWSTAHFVEGTYRSGLVTYDVFAALSYQPAHRQISVLRIVDDVEAFPRSALFVGAAADG